MKKTWTLPSKAPYPGADQGLLHPRNTSEAHVVDIYYDMNFACIETGCRL
ncbi:MAG: hypothetical protein SO188_02210 [Prevotella sp.]|nr:hypothetical protein [Prevotella sp.]